MIKNNDVKRTVFACYLGIFTQAAVLNLSPLFYAVYTTEYNIPLSLVALLPTLVFGLQIIIDAFFSRIAAKLGYKKTAVLADAACVIGLVILGLTPFFTYPAVAVICSSVLCAFGSGIIEITTSPLIEALETENKSSAMSLLHSFYCWGHFLIVLATTAFLWIFGKQNWFIVPFIAALIPLFSALTYLSIKKIRTLEEKGCSNRFSDFGKNKVFFLLVALMICAGAGEQSVAQWASYFAEKGLNVSKSTGDLLGTSLFALFMAIARTAYGILGKKIPLKKALIACSCGLAAAYLITALAPLPVISLAGLALCGACVGIAWPGVLSLAGESNLNGGTLMFALLSLGGDIGCTLGPTLVGEVSSFAGLNFGILCGTVFPVIMIVLLLSLPKKTAELKPLN